MCGTDCFLMLLSVLFPPIGVWVKRGVCSADSLINIALCMLGGLPGILHAWYIILQNPDAHSYEGVQDREREGDGSVTYYYVTRPQPQHPAGQQGGQTSYGTVGSQPSNGQFPGQQNGTILGNKSVKAQPGKGGNVQAQQGVAGQELGGAGGEGSSGQPNGPPPAYADVIKGDNKVQKP